MKALRKIGLSLGLVAALAGCSEPEYLPKLENYARNGQVRISRGYLLDVDGDKIVDALADIEHPDVAIYVNPDSVDKLKTRCYFHNTTPRMSKEAVDAANKVFAGTNRLNYELDLENYRGNRK